MTQTILSTLAELAAVLDTHPTARIVAIVGPPGSGKSTVAAQLSNLLRRSNVVVPMDGFHYPQAQLVAMGRRDRMGAPDTFDAGALVDRLDAVSQRNKSVWFPDFDRNLEERVVPDSIEVPVEADVVLLEGNYLLSEDPDWDPVFQLVDFSAYVQTPEDVRLQRLHERHVAFGKDPDHATQWMRDVDGPNAELVEASAHRADVVLNYG